MTTINLPYQDELNEVIAEHSQLNEFQKFDSVEEAEYQSYLNFMKNVHKPYQDEKLEIKTKH